jgi:hypothetical protein
MLAAESAVPVSPPIGCRPKRIGGVGDARQTTDGLVAAGRSWGQHESNSIPRNPNERQPTPACRSPVVWYYKL